MKSGVDLVGPLEQEQQQQDLCGPLTENKAKAFSHLLSEGGKLVFVCQNNGIYVSNSKNNFHDNNSKIISNQ